MSRGIWKAVEAKAGKVRMAEAKGERGKEGKGNKKGKRRKEKDLERKRW